MVVEPRISGRQWSPQNQVNSAFNLGGWIASDDGWNSPHKQWLKERRWNGLSGHLALFNKCVRLHLNSELRQ